MNKTIAFINTLAPGQRFVRNGETTAYTVVGRYSEPGYTSVQYRTDDGIEAVFGGPGLTTVTLV